MRRILGIAILGLGLVGLAWGVPQVLRGGEEQFFCDLIETPGQQSFVTGIRWVALPVAVHLATAASAALTALGLALCGRRPPRTPPSA